MAIRLVKPPLEHMVWSGGVGRVRLSREAVGGGVGRVRVGQVVVGGGVNTVRVGRLVA